MFGLTRSYCTEKQYPEEGVKRSRNDEAFRIGNLVFRVRRWITDGEILLDALRPSWFACRHAFAHRLIDKVTSHWRSRARSVEKSVSGWKARDSTHSDSGHEDAELHSGGANTLKSIDNSENTRAT